MTIPADQRRALAQEVLDLISVAPPDEKPRAVILMGGVAAGKATLRRSKYGHGFVLIDSADIFIRLSRGEYFDFPGPLEEQMELVGAALTHKALSEKRPIVTEIIGDDVGSTTELLEHLKLIGYSVEVVGITCSIDAALARNESRGEDNISAYYAAPYQTRWITSACKRLSAEPTHAPQTTITMAGQPVFEDADYILFKKHGPFGIRHPMLTSFYVHIKHRGMAVRATGAEKRFLLVVLGEMTKAGLSPDDIKRTSVFSDFCEAVLARSGARWQVFFGARPRELADGYVRA